MAAPPPGASGARSAVRETEIICGDWEAWQIATARASAAWSDAGTAVRPSRAATMCWTWSLSAPPLPQTDIFTACGV